MKITTKSTRYFIIVAAIILGFASLTGYIKINTTVPVEVASQDLRTAVISLISPVGKTIEVGSPVKVAWSSSDYAGKTVNLHLIRKVSDDPITYELVRTIASNKTNTGSATWIPNQNDIGFNVSLEVGCASSNQACIAGNNVSAPLAIVNGGRNSNTASAFEALESLMNR